LPAFHPGGSPTVFSYELPEPDEDTAHSHHSHFLIDTDSIVIRSHGADSLDVPSLEDCAVPASPLFDVNQVVRLVLQTFHGCPPRIILSEFSGLSPPRI
jgi:hypothetical protein